MKALVALEHAMLIAIWHMAHTGALYDDPGPDFFTHLHPGKAKNRAIDQLRHMGYTVTGRGSLSDGVCRQGFEGMGEPGAHGCPACVHVRVGPAREVFTVERVNEEGYHRWSLCGRHQPYSGHGLVSADVRHRTIMEPW